VELVVFLFLLIQLSIVSFQDIRKRKIANYWSLINLLNIPLFFLLLPQHYSFAWEMFQFPLIFFSVSFALFAIKIIGAGDSKYITTFYLCIPAAEHTRLFLVQAELTVAIGIFLLTMNTISNFDKVKMAWKLKDFRLIRNVYGKKFPYSPVLLLSWILWAGFYSSEFLGR
jgi:prepilin peptidase CpaA